MDFSKQLPREINIIPCNSSGRCFVFNAVATNGTRKSKTKSPAVQRPKFSKQIIAFKNQNIRNYGKPVKMVMETKTKFNKQTILKHENHVDIIKIGPYKQKLAIESQDDKLDSIKEDDKVECRLEGLKLSDSEAVVSISNVNNQSNTNGNLKGNWHSMPIDPLKNKRTTYGLRDIPRRDYTQFFYKLDEL